MDRQEIRILLNYLENNSKQLTALQHKFLSSARDHYRFTGFLTKREVDSLYEIKEAITREAEPVYASDSDKYQAQYSSIDYGTFFNAPY